MLGPVISGWISTSGTDWRILYWVVFAFSAGCFIILFTTLSETYAPIILAKKAKQLRAKTGNQELYAASEKEEKRLIPMYRVALTRPFLMLIQEPILALTTLYMSYLYALIYVTFEAYPVCRNAAVLRTKYVTDADISEPPHLFAILSLFRRSFLAKNTG